MKPKKKVTKDVLVAFRLADADRDYLRLAAEVEGMSLSQYILQACAARTKCTYELIMTGKHYHEFPSRSSSIARFLQVLADSESEWARQQKKVQ